MAQKEVKKEEVKKTEDKSMEQIQFERDHKMVRGKFIYHEVRGGELGFPFRKYREDKVVNYNMKDGEIYTVPRMVAEHLNTNCSYPAWDYKSDDQGRPVMSIAEKIRRCSFQPLDFIDEESFPTEEIPKAI